MIGRFLRQIIAQECSDRNRILATFGDTSFARDILKETHHQHFAVHDGVNSRSAQAIAGISRGAELAHLNGKIERSQSLIHLTVKERCRGLNELTGGHEQFRLRQDLGFEHADTITYALTKTN